MPTTSFAQQREDALTKAESIAQAAQDAGRDFTASEIDEIHRLKKLVDELDAKQAHAKQQRERVDAMAKPSSPGQTSSAPADVFTTKALDQLGPTAHRKELITPSGSLTLPTSVAMVAQARPEFSLVPQLGQMTIDTDSFTYLRQTERSSHAQVVAVGEQKPTSSYPLERVEGRAVTVAHLSEPIPRQYLADYAALQQFLSDEMSYGLRRELDRIIVNGSGQGEEPAGMLHTTGVRHQAAGADALATCRSALTTLAVAGEAPSGFVFAPTDWETVETLRDANERYLLAGAPSQQPTRSLWGVPVVLSPELPAGTALVGDFAAATLFTREQIRLDWSESGAELFDTNSVKFRAETRVGLGVTRPGALCTVELSTVSSTG